MKSYSLDKSISIVPTEPSLSSPFYQHLSNLNSACYIKFDLKNPCISALVIN